jgi:hypothetical protein
MGRFVQPTRGDLAAEHYPRSSASQETPRRLTYLDGSAGEDNRNYPRRLLAAC